VPREFRIADDRASGVEPAIVFQIRFPASMAASMWVTGFDPIETTARAR